MAIAPVEIRHVTLKKSFFGGYRKQRVNELLDEIADSFEEVWREREDLRDKVRPARDRAAAAPRARERCSARRLSPPRSPPSSSRTRRAPRPSSSSREAHTAARSITQDALAERERLSGEATRVRALLQAALTSVDGIASRGTQARKRERLAALNLY